MTIKLFFSAITKFLLGVLLVGLLIFLPAGTFEYIQGWILMAILFVPMFCAGIVMMIKNPGLLSSRLDAKEWLSAWMSALPVSSASPRGHIKALRASIDSVTCRHRRRG